MHGRIGGMKRWQFWIGVGISLIFLYIALRGIDFNELGQALASTDYRWLLPGLGAYFLAVWARSWRWHYLLRPLKKIPTKTMFPIVVIGYAGNNIFPARAGEILRAIVLKRKESVAISASLATIIVERVFDGVVMLSFVFLNLSELGQLTSASGLVGSIQSLAIWSTAAFVGALAAFLLAAMFPAPVEKLVDWFVQRLIPVKYRERITGLVGRFLDGLESLRSPRDVLMVFLTSVVIWLLETLKYWLLMQGYSFRISFFGLMLMNGIANLATTIPSAPGYVGTFDASGIKVLEAFNVPQATATAYTLVLHAALLLPITVLGIYYMFKEGIRWGQDMEELKAQAEEQSESYEIQTS